MAVVAIPRTAVAGSPALNPSSPVSGQSPPRRSRICVTRSCADSAAPESVAQPAARLPATHANLRLDTWGDCCAIERNSAPTLSRGLTGLRGVLTVIKRYIILAAPLWRRLGDMHFSARTAALLLIGCTSI